MGSRNLPSTMYEYYSDIVPLMKTKALLESEGSDDDVQHSQLLRSWTLLIVRNCSD
jgi:hypothetical protein